MFFAIILKLFFSSFCLTHGELLASVQLYQGLSTMRVLTSPDINTNSSTAAPSHLLLCHCLMFHIALLCHNQLFKNSHAHHIYQLLAPTPDWYLGYLCTLHTPATAISGVLRGGAKVSWRGKAQPVTVLRDSTGTIRPQDPHILLKSQILLISSHWECICAISLVETWIVQFEICFCVSSLLASVTSIVDILSDDVQTGK